MGNRRKEKGKEGERKRQAEERNDMHERVSEFMREMARKCIKKSATTTSK